MTPEQIAQVVSLLQRIVQELSCISVMFFLYLVSRVFGDKK